MTKTAAGLAAACAVTAVSVALADGEIKIKNTLAIGATLTRGNSESVQGNLSLLTEGEDEGIGSVRLGAEANYGETTIENKNNTTLDNSKLFGNVRKTLSPHWFVYVDTSAMRDSTAGVKYRILAGPGLGCYLVKATNTTLSLEAGASHEWERLEDTSSRFVVVRVAERLTYQISATARLWQSAEFLPEAKDFGNYTMTAEIGVEAALSSRMNLRLVLQDKFSSEPADSLKQNDLSLISGFSTKF